MPVSISPLTRAQIKDLPPVEHDSAVESAG